MNKKITSFEINTSDLPAVASSRKLTIEGDSGARVIVNIYNNSGSFYNFKSNSFAAGHSSDNNLKVTIDGTFSTQISFPAAGAGTYTIMLLAEPNTDTELAVGTGKNVATKSISQVADVTVTFGMVSGTADASSYAGTLSDSNVTSTASPIRTGKSPVDIAWTVTNASSDARGFGLVLDADVIVASDTASFNWNKAWYFEETETVDGTTSSSTSVVVDDLTNLAVGMELTYKTGTTTAAAGTHITAIDTATKTLTLSVANSLTDGNTMTFRAYGRGLIEKITGLSVDFGVFEITQSALTKTVRSAVSASTTINLDGTYGLAGGNLVTYTGAKVDNSAANAITSVSASSSAGSIVVQRAQTLTEDTVLTFSGSTQSMRIIGKPVIKKYPTSNTAVYLNLNKFITLGAAS